MVAKFYKLHSTCLCLHNKYTSTLLDSANGFLYLGNRTWTIQRNWKHMVHRTRKYDEPNKKKTHKKTKQKQKTTKQKKTQTK